MDLESDHCGIEMKRDKGSPLRKYNLESDHCGIEIQGLNRVRSVTIFLESDHCGIEMWSGGTSGSIPDRLRIRPLWD